MSKKCGLSINFQGRIIEWLTLTYTSFHSLWILFLIKFCMFFSLYLTDYLIGLFLIFTPIPLYVQEVWFLNKFRMENNRVAYTHIYIISFLMNTLLNEILYVFLLITDYLIELAFWAIPIGFWYVACSRTKREQIRH